MEPSRRFIKRIPPSGVAPAFKLSLPQNVVYAHLSHWIGRPFELAASKDSEQSWTGSIVPRRNKERAEFTLKGWKLFAEAHGIRTGDQYSFEIVSESRLVISLLAGSVHTGNPSPPPDPHRCGAAGAQTLAAGQLVRHESDLSLSRSSYESQLSDAQAAQAATLLAGVLEPPTTGTFVAPQSVASPMVLESGQDLHGGEKSRDPQTPTSSLAATHTHGSLPAGFERGSLAYCKKGCLTSPDVDSSGSILSCPEFDPLMAVPYSGPGQADSLQAMPSSAAEEPVDWLAGLGGDATMSPSWLPRASPKLVGEPASGLGAVDDCRLKRLRADYKPGTDQPSAGPASVVRLQVGVGPDQAWEDQADRAERERLKQFMLETRDSQQGMLNSVAMLERLFNRLVAYSTSGHPPSRDFTVENIQAEMLGCMQTIKNGIWRFLSTDV